MLDPSPEFIGHWGRFGDLELPIVYTDWAFCKAVRKAHSASSSLSDQEARFSPMVLSRIRFFKPRFDTSTCHLFVDEYAWRDGVTHESMPLITNEVTTRGKLQRTANHGVGTFSYGLFSSGADMIGCEVRAPIVDQDFKVKFWSIYCFDLGVGCGSLSKFALKSRNGPLRIIVELGFICWTIRSSQPRKESASSRSMESQYPPNGVRVEERRYNNLESIIRRNFALAIISVTTKNFLESIPHKPYQ
ncbi:hypothetical protein Tco_0771313 [Tanacetum coccineum]|uniref:Uncharacterized protein n=1 Tax=Tanacetum coccineum TaxID=301880 RepID=A0ABQ4ZI91_9ASTR